MAIRKLQSRQLSISCPDLGKAENLQILCYSDATHASLPNGASQGAYIVFLLGKNNMVAPITWQSKKISRVTETPLALETLSLSEVADAGFMIASMVQEINCLSFLPSVLCKTDNSSLMETLHTTKLVKDMGLCVDIGQLQRNGPTE